MGLRPGTVKPRSAATAAENKPVYSISVYGQDNMIGDTKTHKNEDPISILLPAFDHLVVFFLCSLGYMEKNGPELSPKLDSPCDGGFGVDCGWSG